MNESLSLEYHDTLNPKIWDGDVLKLRFALSMRKYANQFIKFCGIDKSKIKDICFTGSNANYNYTKFSDIDVHILIDETGLNSDTLYDKKLRFQNQYRLMLGGYPLEFFAQDEKEKFPVDQGVYSIVSLKWTQRPRKLSYPKILKSPSTELKIKHYEQLIDKLVSKPGSEKNIKQLKQKFYTMRTAGLERAGEFSFENVLYKELRNQGCLEKLNSY